MVRKVLKVTLCSRYKENAQYETQKHLSLQKIKKPLKIKKKKIGWCNGEHGGGARLTVGLYDPALMIL